MSWRNYYLVWAVATYLSFYASATKVAAQEITRNLSLDKAISSALTNNREIQLATLDERIAAANYKRTLASLLPQVNLSYSAMSTDDPLNAFGFKLQQRSISQADFNPALLNHPSGTQDYMAKLEVQQALINIDMLYLRKGAEKQTEIYKYKTQRSREYLTFEVQKAYLELQLNYDVIKVLEEELQTATAVYTYTDKHFKQGLVQKSDLLNAQVHVLTVRNNLTRSKNNIRNVSDQLGLLMGEKPGFVFIPENSVKVDFQYDLSKRSIASSRADFMVLQKTIESSQLMIKSSQMSYLPKLNAFGNYQYHDNGFVGFGANAYFVGVKLSWDVFGGNRTKNVIKGQKLEHEKLSVQLAQQKDKSQLELDKAYRDLSDAEFEIEQGIAIVEQAMESLRILQNRYRQGLVGTTEILTAETQLSQHRLQLAQAKFKSNITRSYLQFLTTTTK
jgi:outer membrane protein TolC